MRIPREGARGAPACGIAQSSSALPAAPSGSFPVCASSRVETSREVPPAVARCFPSPRISDSPYLLYLVPSDSRPSRIFPKLRDASAKDFSGPQGERRGLGNTSSVLRLRTRPPRCRAGGRGRLRLLSSSRRAFVPITSDGRESRWAHFNEPLQQRTARRANGWSRAWGSRRRTGAACSRAPAS